MLVSSIEEFIKYYKNEFNGKHIYELDFTERKLYGTLLDYCFENSEEVVYI